MSEPEHRIPWQDHGPQYRVVKVRALPGGLEEADTIPAKFATRKSAAQQSERIQAACLEDCEPIQVYVVDCTGARVYRARGDWEQHDEEPERQRLGRFARAGGRCP